jgi:hypothetical protein
MLLQILAAAVFLSFLFSLFRFAMGLRWAKVSREALREEAGVGGRRVVAELPLPSGEVAFLSQDERGFAWGEESVDVADVIGLRMRLNGGVLAEWTRDGVRLPPPAPGEEYEGRERWDVAIFERGGRVALIPCGVLREGVSREVAASVFQAVKRALTSSMA